MPEERDSRCIRVYVGTILMAESLKLSLDRPMIEIIRDALILYHDFCALRGFNWSRIQEDSYRGETEK